MNTQLSLKQVIPSEVTQEDNMIVHQSAPFESKGAIEKEPNMGPTLELLDSMPNVQVEGLYTEIGLDEFEKVLKLKVEDYENYKKSVLHSGIGETKLVSFIKNKLVDDIGQLILNLDNFKDKSININDSHIIEAKKILETNKRIKSVAVLNKIFLDELDDSKSIFEAVILPLNQLLIASTDVEGRSSKDLEGFQKVFELFNDAQEKMIENSDFSSNPVEVTKCFAFAGKANMEICQSLNLDKTKKANILNNEFQLVRKVAENLPVMNAWNTYDIRLMGEVSQHIIDNLDSSSASLDSINNFLNNFKALDH
ncbi:MAG: hypothetical protein HRT47_08980 [Candidatus Caenarcaniphilales bacterium]|nr:hypothetical protein [Candidatus Caenarcaniphilales bacterium]